VTISALAGFLIGSPGAIDVWTLLVTLVGTGLCAGGVGVLNHCMEQDLDARMKRTAARPLPAGRVNPTTAGFFGMALVAAGIGLLCPLVNPLTAILAALTAVLYLFVYTPLKQVTTYNTLIGTIPGALPALGGYTAATGSVGWGGWTAFAVLACWQMPHFLSLAWMYRKDYARGEYAMLPVEQPDGDATAYQMIGFTVLLLAASLVPSVWGDAHLLYTVGAAALGGWFLYTAVRFFRRRTGHQARRVLKASIVYVPVWVALLFVDWLLT
jgi:protoheme IX farnesyltransferase